MMRRERTDEALSRQFDCSSLRRFAPPVGVPHCHRCCSSLRGFAPPVGVPHGRVNHEKQPTPGAGSIPGSADDREPSSGNH